LKEISGRGVELNTKSYEGQLEFVRDVVREDPKNPKRMKRGEMRISVKYGTVSNECTKREERER